MEQEIFGALDYQTPTKILLFLRPKIVPNFPLTHFMNFTSLPDGIFGAISEETRLTRESFNNGTAEFVFIPWDEWED